MITNLDPSTELFLSSVERIQQRLAEASRQVSSGKRIATPADAPPDQIGALLQLRAERQRNTQITTNLSGARGDASAADTALSSAIQLMDRALVLASEGANFSQTSDTRRSLADEVASLQTNMLSYSRTAVQGRNIFSETVSGATRQVEDPAGGSFADAKTADEIFNSTTTSENVFTTLENLRQALLANDPNGVSNTIASLKQSSLHLNSMQAFYGRVQKRIQAATEYAAACETRLATQISQLEDADIPAAATEMVQANTQLQAAFQARAKMRQNTLFDFLA